MPWLLSWIKSSIVKPQKLVKMSKTTKLKNSYLNSLRQILKVIIKAILTSFFGVAILGLVLNDNQSITKPNQANPAFLGTFTGVLTLVFDRNPKNPPEVI